ncbi:thermonuclease family protein [Thermosulfurimonas sp. F29]|uniref:thermonuclease family protein n=1 Tax=Thermosulfurimonas sp. F29 TaxID=2867247 RepID=UPI001C83590E|nr:thermonuclease family protein [Thermosulfurimonas sp. F29]MBX6423327.1 thermonuclease family protein [Thermosulfurimonas sp. F29]
MIAALWLSLTASPGLASDENLPIRPFRARILRVVDGDTVWVKNLASGRRVKVRIWGIDTPEKFPSRKLSRDARRCHVDAESIRRLGREASLAAMRLLDRRVVEVIPEGRGYYGRLLARIVIPPDLDFGKWMIENGYACIYRRNREAEAVYGPALRQAETHARGLWRETRLMMCLCR